MKKMILILLMAAACQTEDTEQENMSLNYIIFGHFYGECIGEQCIEIYKLTENSLYEDTKDTYPSFVNAYTGDFQLLDNSMFEKVNDLRNEIPSELLAINSPVIGQPDFADGGGLYVEIATGGEKQYWLIDKMESNIPEALRPFVEELESKIQSLHD